ncbi:MAG: MATE family efflux transporter [Eubacteriales bacterium]|jgi:putative MATE family efflux protein
MRKVDFENSSILKNIVATTLPMLVAQLLNLLYSIVDRIYIARIPEVGTAALGAVGLCFPIIIIITGFTNMFGGGGQPLFSMAMGRGDREEAEKLQNTSFVLILITSVIITVAGEIFARPILIAFGASENALQFAIPYLRIYLLGTVLSMTATGLNPFINAQGFTVVGMVTVIIGAVANIILDPLFIFAWGMGVSGAAIATVLSQLLSAIFVLRFLAGPKADYRIRLMRPKEFRACRKEAKDIIGLGTADLVMQLTNSLVLICANDVLADIGGDIYVSIMTIVNTARQVFETPLLAIASGATPVLSYNYGARKPERVRVARRYMFWIGMVYALVIWVIMMSSPQLIIRIFSDDATIMDDAVPAIRIYFSTFFFMMFQYTGQTTFKALGKKKRAVFFSLLRKAFIVAPLTFIFPYVFGMGTDGVFMAEPVSNVIGGLASFITMMITVGRELRDMEKSPAE